MSEQLIVYGTPTCPMVPPILRTLKRADVAHQYINIQRDSAAYERVLEINGGFASVPTLVFPDGETLTEPSGSELVAALEARGVSIAGGAASIWLLHPAIMIMGGIFFAVGLMQGDGVLTAVGAVLLVVALGARMFR
jgi:mycoredoxin